MTIVGERVAMHDRLAGFWGGTAQPDVGGRSLVAQPHIAKVAVYHGGACQSSCWLHCGEGCGLWPQLNTSCSIARLLFIIDVYTSLLLQTDDGILSYCNLPYSYTRAAVPSSK